MKNYRKMNKTDLVAYAGSLGLTDVGDLTKAEIVTLIDDMPEVQEARAESEKPVESEAVSEEAADNDEEDPVEQIYPAEVNYPDPEPQETPAEPEPATDDAVEKAVKEVRSEITRGRIGKFAGAGFFKYDTEGRRTPMMNIIRDVFRKAENKSLEELAAGEFTEKCIVYNAVQNGQVFVRCNSTSRTKLVKAE